MGYRYPKRIHLKCTKQRCRVRDRPEYAARLAKRDDLTLWFWEEAIAAWQAPNCENLGGQPIYADQAIEAPLTVRLMYGLALRQNEVFLRSHSPLLGLGPRIPYQTTVSRCSKRLDSRIPPPVDAGPVRIIIDAIGLRVNSGNVAGSGPPDRPGGRKLHIVVTANTHDFLASSLIAHCARNAAQVPELVAQADERVDRPDG